MYKVEVRYVGYVNTDYYNNITRCYYSDNRFFMDMDDGSVICVPLFTVQSIKESKQ